MNNKNLENMWRSVHFQVLNRVGPHDDDICICYGVFERQNKKGLYSYTEVVCLLSSANITFKSESLYIGGLKRNDLDIYGHENWISNQPINIKRILND